MKKTAFNDLHKKLGAKMVPFAGYEMPIQYPNGIIHEHHVVRSKVGVFDVTHMGEFIVTGPDALAFVQKVTTNDASKLNFGKVQYSSMCFENGSIVDDLLVYCFGEYFMLVVNASNMEKDFNWLSANTAGFDVKLTDISDEVSLLAVQGPDSVKTLQKLTEIDLSQIEYYNFTEGKMAGLDMIISRTGYTGELGFELYMKCDEATACDIWEQIFASGQDFGIEPVGLGCRDTLRLEKGYCLYGNDIDETTHPLEAGLGWITKFAKGKFNGSEAMQTAKAEGLKRRLVGFLCSEPKFIPRHDYKIFSGETEIGKVTSGNISPILNKGMGMAYLTTGFEKLGTQIEIEARGKRFIAEVAKLPFV
ncbi:MAG: glycine cleavage system aminomethyltransferase GcvT [Candidatus Kapabacteria bacterium]|nr:glycine cleavage system aminomethyltransferase GcvT [Candidatus Kapabacteria bacterium]